MQELVAMVTVLIIEVQVLRASSAPEGCGLVGAFLVLAIGVLRLLHVYYLLD